MLKPQEIDTIVEIGTLDGSPVKMIRTIGGFFVAAGRPKGKNQDEALAAGSHPAIVKYNVEKQYALRYSPMLAKSEAVPEPVVADTTAHLDKNSQDKGFKMYSMTHMDRVDTVITHRGNEVMAQTALKKAESLEVQTEMRITDAVKAKHLTSVGMSLLKSFADAAVTLKKEFVQIEQQPKKIKADALKKG